uniref:Uncharacterized protein n=1 Tax=Magallana gigas TaxID=29159 RepID=A0A8W8MZ79_MAGGI
MRGYQDAVCTVGGGIDWHESCDQLVLEQVRRYNEFEKKNQDDRIPRKPKKVRYLKGDKKDRSIEEMIELEIQESALKEAEREIEEIR